MKLGFIGCGNMAKAMLGGILKNEICAKEDVIATAKSEASRENARNTYEIKDAVDEKKIIISIAPGKTLAWLEEQFGKKVKLVRCMPNTPALVGEGMTGVCCNEEVSDAEMQDVLKILESCGKAEMLPERLIDVVVSVSGSSPAYVFMFIEAMADEAVAAGMPRKQAYEFAAQSVLGSAKMVLETGKHPGELKDMVCSPGGTTIQAVKVLEEKGMRAAVMDAMDACIEKSKCM